GLRTTGRLPGRGRVARAARVRCLRGTGTRRLVGTRAASAALTCHMAPALGEPKSRAAWDSGGAARFQQVSDRLADHRRPALASEPTPRLVEGRDLGGGHAERQDLHVGGRAGRATLDRPDSDAALMGLAQLPDKVSRAARRRWAAD